LLRWIWAYLFDCVHFHTTWPHQNKFDLAYVCCLDCGREMPYSLEYMQIVRQDHKRSFWGSRSPATVPLIIAAALLLTPSYAVAQNAQAQTACEAEMLGQMDAHQLFSGKLAPVSLQILHLLVADAIWIMIVLASAALVFEHPYAHTDRAPASHGVAELNEIPRSSVNGKASCTF
jgi:hypothetical protein